MITFNGVTEISIGLTVKDVFRAIMPPVKNRLAYGSKKDGAIDFGSDVEIREFTITFQSKNTITKEELQDLRKDIALWIFPDRSLHELTFDDEPTVHYMARINGSTDIKQIQGYGLFEVTFISTETIYD